METPGQRQRRRPGPVEVPPLARRAMERIFDHCHARKLQLATLFDMMDRDSSDSVEAEELQGTCAMLGLRIDDAEVRAMAALLDVDGDGE
jgi:Ca2+-binding EF-hand superfamily protein